MTVISFDRDGTLEFSSGPITLDVLKRLKDNGFIIGTGGGASSEEQANQWRNWGMEPDFALTKADLGKLKKLYPDAEITHVGNDSTDKQAAEQNNFNYLTPQEFIEKYGL